jgi:hypothetical protein
MSLTMSTNLAKDSHTSVVIRSSERADAARLRRLAQLDSARLGDGPMVVAEIEGEVRAAVSIDDGSVIADPFHRTAELIALAETRAAQLRLERTRPLRLVASTPSQAARLRRAA